MKDLIATLILTLFCITAVAGQSTSADTTLRSKPIGQKVKKQKKQEVKYADASGYVSPISLQILTGSQGIGADVKYGILPKLSARLGFGIIPIDASREFTVSFPVQGQLSSRFSNIHLLADYSPFNSKIFRIVGGAAYLTHGSADVIITPSSGYTIGSQSLSGSQIGSINAEVTWKGIAPYLGFSLLQSFPNRFFNINLDVGSYYLSRPGTSFTGTKLLSDNDAGAKQFNENMQGYRWLPVVQLNFNFRIK